MSIKTLNPTRCCRAKFLIETVSSARQHRAGWLGRYVSRPSVYLMPDHPNNWRSVPLTEFNETGDLPTGVHEASLAETVARFGTGSDRRKLIARRLERIHQIASQTGRLARFVVFGSFVTDKHEPNDVDVFMIMDDNFDMGSLVGEPRLLFVDHGTAQDHFGASVFWMRRMAAIGGEQSAIEDWQIKRDGTERGIVEITAESS